MPLAEYFLTRLNHELGKNVVRIPNDYLEALQAYDWPGNVRELENVLRRGAILSHGDVLELDENWLRKKGTVCAAEGEPSRDVSGVPKSLAEIEREHIVRVLEYTDGNYGEACKILGITRPTLRKKLQDYGLREEL